MRINETKKIEVYVNSEADYIFWLTPALTAGVRTLKPNAVYNIPNTLKNLKTKAILVFTEKDVLDIKHFHDNPEQLRDLLSSGEAIIKRCSPSLDDLTREEFHWKYCNKVTKPSNTFKEAIADLPNSTAIEKIAELIEEFGISWAPLDIQKVTDECLKPLENLVPSNDNTVSVDEFLDAITPEIIDKFLDTTTNSIKKIALHLKCVAYIPIDLEQNLNEIPIRYINDEN